MNKFLEYVNSRGKIEKARTDIHGGDPDPKTPPNSPPKGKPYKAKGMENSKKPFGEMGDSELKIKFDTEGKGKAPAKIPTVEQVQLSNVISESCVQDPTVLETVIRTMKTDGLLGLLVAELLEHKETFNHISEIMAHKRYGPTFCSKLVRAMEQTAPSFHSQLEDDEEEDFDDSAEDDPDESLDVDMEDSEGEGEDPNMMGEDPNAMMDPNMQQDPNAMMDPNMQQDPNAMMDPNMMGQPPMGMPPMGMPQPPMPPAMMNMQQAMMRKYMRQD